MITLTKFAFIIWLVIFTLFGAFLALTGVAIVVLDHKDKNK